SRRRHTRWPRDWSSDVCSSDLATPEELVGNWMDGRIKLFLTQRLLRFRRQNAELFRQGNYRPLNLTGEFADCCIAFARELEDRRSEERRVGKEGRYRWARSDWK